MKEFEREANINKRYQVVATFNAAPTVSQSTSDAPSVVDDTEYISILESLDMPLYLILHDVSYP